jgi:hypothetical protein
MAVYVRSDIYAALNAKATHMEKSPGECPHLPLPHHALILWEETYVARGIRLCVMNAL